MKIQRLHCSDLTLRQSETMDMKRTSCVLGATPYLTMGELCNIPASTDLLLGQLQPLGHIGSIKYKVLICLFSKTSHHLCRDGCIWQKTDIDAKVVMGFQTGEECSGRSRLAAI